MNARRFLWNAKAPCFAAALALAMAGPVGADDTKPTVEQVEFFEKKIRPVLVEHCFKCHAVTAKKVRGGLLLDSRAGLRKGGDSGPAIIPGDPAASRLIKALRYDELQMPPDGKLPDKVIADFETWIKQGAVDPGVATAAKSGGVGNPAPNSSSEVKIDFQKAKQFWAFQPPRRHEPPQLRKHDWPRRRIDQFILAGLEQAGLGPNPPADRRTWLRRVSFDLVGLPPTPEEIEAFVSDQSADAVEKVVERLLASPHYGERWARMWLDVARYAEDQAHIVGNDQSLTYPNAYLYRDWVIRALNADMPYDRFLTLQLAADLAEPSDPSNHVALGFLGLGPKYYDRRRLEVMADEWEDRVDVVGRGLLGLTVACARCHDHKYDPIPTEDYYALAGVFASTRMTNQPLDAKCEKKPDGDAKQPKDALHVVHEGTPTDLNVFVRGDVNTKGPVAPRHFLHVLCAGEPARFTQGSGRLELAKAITSRDNPLTSRVIVNRVWAQFFGRPLVGTPSNFGALGERPSHPELLDDLAVRFTDAGWSLKWLHREIALSATYGQDSLEDSRPPGVDVENRLLGRMNRRRLSVEAWRDAILAATGRLDGSLGGKSIEPSDSKERRRTIYSRVSRLSLNPVLALFDFPDPNIHADHRVETTTPLQKLFVMNDPFMVRQAEALTERLSGEVAGDSHSANEAFIRRAYLLLYSRPALERELQLGLEFLRRGDDIKARRRQYAQVLLAANEMLYID
ncbi:MAG TPA: PSD1 and planctomycete cytochrome C domain-containing protein [Gemmataceae bacterium]|nr:PSD1 and planctomycete cytochrome C domain-containing protein [Gemmataceae bacterium]